MPDSKVLHGTLEKYRFPEVLVKVAARKETGVLRLSHHKLEKTVYLQDGNVIFSKSNDPDDRLGPLLLRQNKITLQQLTDCDPKVTEEKRLGTILVLEGHIQPDDLVHGVTDQVKEIIYSLFDWEEGFFEFRPGALPTSEIITLNLSLPDLIFHGMTRIRRWSWISKGVGALDEVFRKRAGWTTIIRKMMLTTETETLLDLFDRPRTLNEILQLSPLSSFEACKQIWFFQIIGIVEQILQPPGWELEEFETGAEMISAPPPPEITHEIPVPVAQLREESSTPIATSLASDDTGQLGGSGLAEPAFPTIKIHVPDTEAGPAEHVEEPASDSPDTQAMPLKEIVEPAAAPTIPVLMLPAETFESSSVELSFSDLADLTDAVEEETPVLRAEKEAPEKPALKKEDILFDLKAFNELHRYIFELIRLEIGPGVTNFLSKTLKKVSAKFPLLFEGVSMNDFGELDQHSLTLNIEGNLLENYKEVLEFLLEEERSQIRLFLEPKRVQVIESGIKKMQKKHKPAIS